MCSQKMAVTKDGILWYQCLMKTFLIVCSLVLLSKDATCLVCYCAGRCPGQNQANGTCLAEPESGCFSAVEKVLNPETGVLEYERTYGCLPPEKSGFMQCKGHLEPHVVPKSIACCSNKDLCNKYLEPTSVTTTSSPVYKEELLTYDGPSYSLVVFVATASVCILILATVAIVMISWCINERRRYNMDAIMYEGGYLCGNSEKYLLDSNVTEGPFLRPMTIGRRVQMVESIGKGCFGEVWKGSLWDELVAVKIFFTSEKASWEREIDIYRTDFLKHGNILGFIGADIIDTGSLTQMLLITDYHELGSLHDYLKDNVLDISTMMKLAHSAASGLSYLHLHFVGNEGKLEKPAIVHRDIRSRNILVKKDRTCAIADFGLAVKYKDDTKQLDVVKNTRVGARRYMAPEVLDETLEASNFEAYKKADMYSFALVLWEIVRRCTVNGVVEEYQLPFYEYAPSNVSLEDMKKVVCVDQKRPFLPIYSCQTMRAMSKTIQEIWSQNPAARLNSLGVKKTLSKIESYNKGEKLV